MHQVRALCHEAVQHVVRGEDVSIRREGHPEEARGYAHFETDTLLLHLPGHEAVGLDQLVSIEHLPLSQPPSRPAIFLERAARAAGSTSLPARGSTSCHSPTSSRTSSSTSGSSSCLFKASERSITHTRYRNVVRVSFIDAQGGDRSLDRDIFDMSRKTNLIGPT
jgi:hypothetical protein